MTKYLEKEYPKGSFPYQKSDGKYINENLKCNLDILAEKIVDDLQFVGIISTSRYEVRSGKSTLAQQMGEYYIDSVNRQQKLNLTFDMNNIVFNTQDLIKRAFELPRYSVLILDEDDEADEHYFSKLSKELRKFFKISGSLNLFIIIVNQNFFQLKKQFAISRSNFLIDVRFKENTKFERGQFDYYSFEGKKKLYLAGKKYEDWSVAKPEFRGAFTKGYCVNEELYRQSKRSDMVRSEQEKSKTLTEKQRIPRFLIYHSASRANSFSVPIQKNPTENMLKTAPRMKIRDGITQYITL